MSFKKHKPEETIGKLRKAEIVLAQGASVGEMCRRLSVREETPAFAGAGSIIGGARNMAVWRPIRRDG